MRTYPLPEWMYPPGPAARKMADDVFEVAEAIHEDAYMIDVRVRVCWNYVVPGSNRGAITLRVDSD